MWQDTQRVMKVPLFYQLPFAVNALIILGFLLGCLEISYRIGLWQLRRIGEVRKMDRRDDVILTAMLALLGLILAFTYSFTVNRSDKRKTAAVEEINAVGTAFNRADLLEEPHRTEIRRRLLAYARVLPIDYETVNSSKKIQVKLEQIAEAQAEIWPAVRRMTETHQPNALTNAMVQSPNDVFDAHTRRFMAALDRLPGEIMLILVSVAGACLSVVGYSAGRADSLRRTRAMAMILVLVAVMMMIIDFDRSVTGFVRTSHAGLHRRIQAMEAASEE